MLLVPLIAPSKRDRLFYAIMGCFVISHYCPLQKATPAGCINLGDVIEVSPFHEGGVFQVYTSLSASVHVCRFA